MKQQYTITSAIQRLQRNGAIRSTTNEKQLEIRQPGVRLLGAVSFLQSQGYIVTITKRRQ